jgi:hypothetical protein
MNWSDMREWHKQGEFLPDPVPVRTVEPWFLDEELSPGFERAAWAHAHAHAQARDMLEVLDRFTLFTQGA